MENTHPQLDQVSSLYDMASECLKLLTEDGRLLHINNTGLAMIEADSFDQVAGQCMYPLICDEYRQAFITLTRDVFNGKSGSLEFEIIGLKGTRRWLETHATPLRDSAGTITSALGITRDITLRKHSEAELKESQLNLAKAQAHAKLGNWRRNLHTGVGHWSLEMYRLFERDPNQPPPSYEELVQLIHPDDRARFTHYHDRFISEGDGYLIDFRILQKSGIPLWLEARSETIRDDNGQASFLTGTAQDISDRKQAELALQSSEFRFRAFMEKSPLLAFIKDERGHYVYVNPTFEREFQLQPGQLIGKTDAEFLSADVARKLAENDAAIFASGQQTEFTEDVPTPKGMRHWLAVKFVFSNSEGQRFLGGTALDLTERYQAEQDLLVANRELERTNSLLEHIAHYDALTHLPNRVLLADRMRQAMLQTQRDNHYLAVAFLDLDGFKAINDRFGHSLGDELLILLSYRMKNALRESDTLARIGGDEFVVVLTNLVEPQDCEPLLQRLLKAASDPLDIGDLSLEVSASIGVTLYPQDGVDAEQLLRHADQAMYLAKQAGKNCYHLFDVAQDTAVKTQRAELSNIRQGLEQREFVLFYQPKVNMRTGAIIGVEALIRWQHPERGLLAPASFLPILENHVLSVQLGEWVIEEALQQIARWQQQGLTISISVNLSAMQLQQTNFVERLRQLLARHQDTNPALLEFEILETSALDDIMQVSTIVHDCQKLGVSFALDDFGTGYSSLAYLKRLPTEILKIDQTFIRDMLVDADDLAIIEGIVGLARAFNRQVIAEGVETVAHGEQLLRIGCELAQGYGIARPMPASEVPDWVKRWQPFESWRNKVSN